MSGNQFQHDGRAPSHGVWDPASNRFYPTKNRDAAIRLAEILNVQRPRGEQRTTKKHVRKPGEEIPRGSQIMSSAGAGRSGSRFAHLLVDLIQRGFGGKRRR